METMYETELDSFDCSKRKLALNGLIKQYESGSISLPKSGRFFNMHCHSFYSFSGYGFSPTHLAWQGRKLGLSAMAMVDFDVLDGVEEFLSACARLGLRGSAGLETRVYVPEFSDYEINSPGEPGVSYHVGLGFVKSSVQEKEILDSFKHMAQKRTRLIVEKVNAFLNEVALDYEHDVLCLTPAGNATERHVCAAYDLKARSLFNSMDSLSEFWAAKLKMADAETDSLLKSPPAFQAILRGKTMKSGGVGYIPSKGEDFPELSIVNQFIIQNGAIPAFAFLDGTSSGEMKMEELLDVMTASGITAVNIIPDRNWNIKDTSAKEVRLVKLNEFVKQARARNLPIIVGTEMNAYGQRMVDDFNTPELAPYFDDFEKGMYLLYGHTALQSIAGIGYSSTWSNEHFDSAAERNLFYARIGEEASPERLQQVPSFSASDSPAQILKHFSLK